MALTHLGCPACGGTLSLGEGQRLVSCRYCGGTSLVLIPGALPRYVVAAKVSREAAQARAREVFKRSTVPRSLRTGGRVRDLTLCYVPFYEFAAIRVGTFLLRDSVKPPPPEGEEGYSDTQLQQWLLERPVVTEETRVLEQEYVRIKPACTLPELGVEHIPLAEMRRDATPVALEPFDLVSLQSRGIVFSATEPPGRFSDEAQWRIKVRSDRTGWVEQRLKVLYYPVWQARYLHRGRPYEIAIDGVTGKLLRASAPAETRRAAVVGVGALALGAFCIGRFGGEAIRTLLPLGQTSGHSSGVWLSSPLVLIGVLALGLAWLGLTTHRRGGELVLSGSDALPALTVESTPGSLGRIRAAFAEWLLGLEARLSVGG